MSRGKCNVAFTKPEDPPFLQAIKARAGYVAPPTIDAKRAALPSDDADVSDEEQNEEYKPQVVALKSGDLTEEQVEKLLEEKEMADDRKKIEERKITFKVPSKRTAEDTESGLVSSTKKQAVCSTGKQAESKAVKESRLLSFADEDTDD